MMCDRALVYESLIKANPWEESHRLAYEQCLEESDPDSVELQLMQMERQIRDACLASVPLDDLMFQYKKFRIDNSYYFWDERGSMEWIFRPFSLWFVDFNSDRLFAIERAIENKTSKANSIAVPFEVARNICCDEAFELKNDILDFVRRYRGPTGREPELEDAEIVFEIRSSTYRPEQETIEPG